MTLTLARFASPLGALTLATDPAARLKALLFDGFTERYLARALGDAETREGPPPELVREALTAYFDGELTALEALATDATGTGFQKAVWTALRDIPPGRTESYGVLAARLGKPNARRAVGLATGANPIAIVVPCHRVIGANGALTGYGGGLPNKTWLLRHEGAAFLQPQTRLI